MDEKITKENIIEWVKEYMKSNAFTDRKLTDNPTDALQVVNRKYVTLNGGTANRPTSSVIGQFYYDTDIHKPIWYDGVSFKDASGNVV